MRQSAQIRRQCDGQVMAVTFRECRMRPATSRKAANVKAE